MDDNLSREYRVGGEEEKESMPTLVSLGELSWNTSKGYGGKALFLKGGRKNWLFLRG